jgi:hypothetical protein
MSLDTDAEEVWSILKEEIDIFPSRSCKFAVLAMHKRGYKIASSIVKLDNYCGLGIYKEIGHFLTFDETSEKFADLTSPQFNGDFHGIYLPKIGIWHAQELPSIYHILQKDVSPYSVI